MKKEKRRKSPKTGVKLTILDGGGRGGGHLVTKVLENYNESQLDIWYEDTYIYINYTIYGLFLTKSFAGGGGGGWGGGGCKKGQKPFFNQK